MIKYRQWPEEFPGERRGVVVSHLFVKKFDVETNNVADGLSLGRDVVHQELAYRGHHRFHLETETEGEIRDDAPFISAGFLRRTRRVKTMFFFTGVSY